MNILFLSISSAVNDLKNRGIYPDLMRKFAKEGHNIYVVCPLERKNKQKTELWKCDNVSILKVKTLNLTKANYFEKFIAIQTLGIFYLYYIKKYFSVINFDLVLYSTPPITFNRLIKYFKNRGSATYLLLKDIFPQNAIDLGYFKKNGFLHRYYRKLEMKVYELSDFIGCMSRANVDYLLVNNIEISELKVEICPNSIEILNRRLKSSEEIHNQYDLPHNKLLLIYGGNLGKPQGIDFLIEVLRANMHNDEIYFIIAGDGTERWRLERFSKDQKPQNIRLFNMLSESEYIDLIHASDCGLVFLDRRFTIPNFPSRILNYMELKKPILLATDPATDVGRICEENGFGYWVQSGDIDAFNNRLSKIISNKAKLTKMGEKGYQFLKKNYDVDTSYRIITSHFNNV